LDIPLRCGTTFYNRDDMVEFEAFLSLAFDALAAIALPNKHP